MIVILPPEFGATSGKRIPLDGVGYYRSSAGVITFQFGSGNSITYTDPDQIDANIPFVLAQLDDALNSGQAIVTIKQRPYQVSISNGSYNITTDPMVLNFIGGPSPIGGILHIEDPSGGYDDNGYFYNCVKSGDASMAASVGGAGDGGLPANGNPILVYFKDPSGAVSNTIPATFISGTTITVP